MTFYEGHYDVEPLRQPNPHPGAFPRGPLTIGGDDRIRPVEYASGPRRCLALSATDSCRDRLAAFYHWNDRQSLEVAVLIALINRLDWRKIRNWSAAGGFAARYEEFVKEVRWERRRR